MVATHPFVCTFDACKGGDARSGGDGSTFSAGIGRDKVKEHALGQSELYARLNCLQGA